MKIPSDIFAFLKFFLSIINCIGKIGASDVNLFYNDSALFASYSAPFTPTFLDLMVSQGTITQAAFNTLMASCNNVYTCASDTILTGNPSFGAQTGQAQASIETANAIQSKKNI